MWFFAQEDTVTLQAVNVAQALIAMSAAALVAVLLYVVAARTLFRFRKTDRFAQEVTDRCRWPGRVTVALIAALASLPGTNVRLALPEFYTVLQHGLSVAVILTATWWALRMALAIEATMLSSLDVEHLDDQFARRRRTQVILVRRISAALVIIVSIGAVLMTFETARSLGTSLLASAGIFGLVAGIAAQTTLGNLVAGIQIAIAEPIKLDDVVVVEGEWGNIEEITLTYVVVKIWDRRRLVLPTSYFVQNPVVNWTRNGTQLMGTIYFHLDHRTPIDRMRAEFLRQVEGHPQWDGDFASLLVTDTTEDRLVVRGLVTARDAWDLWNLRCALREAMVTWLVTHHPEALPAMRLLEAAPMPDRPPPEPPPASGPPPEPTPSDPMTTQELPTPPWATPSARPHRRPR